MFIIIGPHLSFAFHQGSLLFTAMFQHQQVVRSVPSKCRRMGILGEWSITTFLRMRELQAGILFLAGLAAPLTIPAIRTVFFTNVATRMAYFFGIVYLVKRFKAGMIFNSIAWSCIFNSLERGQRLLHPFDRGDYV
jgi:hypothetical protein